MSDEVKRLRALGPLSYKVIDMPIYKGQTADKYRITADSMTTYVIERDPQPVLKTLVFRFESQYEFEVFKKNILDGLNIEDNGFELVAIEDGDKLDDEQ